MSADRNGNAYRFKAVWHTLRKLGINRVTVEFSGEGDSGQIDDVSPSWPHDSNSYAVARHKAQCDAFKEAMVDWPEGSTEAPRLKLEKLVEQLSDDILQKGEIPDWYNHEGGNGTIEWVVSGKNMEGVELIDCTVNQRIVEYSTSCFSYDSHGQELVVPEQAP